jgi:hypothetical protein
LVSKLARSSLTSPGAIRVNPAFLREILHIHEQFWQPDESLCSILWLHQSETRLAVLVLFCHPGTPTFV